MAERELHAWEHQDEEHCDSHGEKHYHQLEHHCELCDLNAPDTPVASPLGLVKAEGSVEPVYFSYLLSQPVSDEPVQVPARAPPFLS